MKVILLQNVKGIGQIGDIKNVSDGYGRNFLIPKNLAKIATDTTLKEAEALKAKYAILRRVEEHKAKEKAETMKGQVFEMKRSANTKGTLFDGIERMDIAQTLRDATGDHIEEDMIILKEPIKKLGKHTMELELTPEIRTEIILEVKNTKTD